MAWVVLFVSAAFETVWATALGRSDGFTRPAPTVVFAVTIVASLLAFGYVLKHIPISTAYAVWTGTGAALTVLWGMATGAEPVTFLRVLFIAGIVGCVVGLKLVPAHPLASATTDAPAESAGRSSATRTVSGEENAHPVR